MPSALVTGAAGQDGSYLCELLLREGWEVTALVRPSGQNRLQHLPPPSRAFRISYGDVLDSYTLITAARAGFDAIYHLAGQSHVMQSNDAPSVALAVNAGSTFVLLDALFRSGYLTRFYFAGSSEMFAGMRPPERAAETYPLGAHSPYAAAKVAGFLNTRIYRARGLFTVGGIAFNHESRRRSDLFVTRKLALGVRRFLRTGEPARLGNPDALRDWHHASDTMRGAYLAMTAPEPGEYVFASGVARTVREMAAAICAHLGAPPEAVTFGDTALLRPIEVDYLCGNPEKAESVLGWQRAFDYPALIEDICLET